MGYSSPISVTYNFNAVDFGAGSSARKIKPPQGKTAGRVAGIHAAATELFTQTTTQAFIRVGTVADADKFAELDLGALASGASKSDGEGARKLSSFPSFELQDEADDELSVAFVAPTGGTPGGIADVALTVEWF